MPTRRAPFGVAAQLIGHSRVNYAATVRREYVEIAERYVGTNRNSPGRRLSLAAARANGLKFDWSRYTPPKPRFLGLREFRHYDLAELVPYIDWTPFFSRPGNWWGAIR